MKIPAFIPAAALCTILSTPAHAYLIDFEMLHRLSGNPPSKNLATDTGEKRHVTSKARKAQDWSTTFSVQPIEESLTASVSWSTPAFSPGWHNTFISAKNSKGAVLSTQLAARNLWDKDVHDNQTDFAATSGQESNFSPLAAANINDNEFWLADFRDPRENLLNPALDLDETLWRDKDRDMALADNPVTTSSARIAVPEPSSLGLMVLGFSALALSRRRAQRKSA